MANFTNELGLILTAGLALAILTQGLIRRESRRLNFPLLVASIALFTWGSFGLMTSPTALSAPEISEKPAPEQELQATTSSGKYIGLEYVQGSTSGNRKGDQEIINTVKDLNDELVVQSSNGSVLLSGQVNDRQTARSLVDSIKEIPGVIQVSYELSLEED